MKLLVVTHKVDKDDEILGFFHGWILEFSRKYEQVIVVCFEEGEYDLPGNVQIFSLRKAESGSSTFTYALTFLSLIWGKRNDYDHVFIHMMPKYGALGGVLWRILGKKIGLWYASRLETASFKFAEKFAHVVFTPSGYGFQLHSNKRKIVGRGVDVHKFRCENEKSPNILNILSVGHIAREKNCDTLVRAGGILKESLNDAVRIIFVGGTTTEDDETYLTELKQLTSELSLEENVEFVGKIPSYKIPRHYCNATYTVNMSDVGEIDDAVIESMASKTPVFTSNEALRAYFGDFANDLIFKERDEHDLSEKIIKLHRQVNSQKMGLFLEQQAHKIFSIERLVEQIASSLH